MLNSYLVIGKNIESKSQPNTRPGRIAIDPVLTCARIKPVISIDKTMFSFTRIMGLGEGIALLGSRKPGNRPKLNRALFCRF
jgi:hypothetical protein